MLLLKLLISTLTLSNYVNSSGGHNVICQKGHRVSINRRGGCEACPDGSYQPKENYSQQCKPCTICETDLGSSTKEECTKETDTICQCREGFEPLESDASTCKCKPGFGLSNQVCSECKDGYFNNQDNKPCQKWKECKSGVKITGSSTTDVVCNDLRNDTTIIKRTNTQSTSHPLLEENQTKSTHTIPTTTVSQPHRVTKNEKVDPTFSSNPGHYIGMVLLMLGITGLLILTLLTCKLHITPCVSRKRAKQTNDSCRRPVEESGISLSSLKLNLEEP